jgi:hypothetical protein
MSIPVEYHEACCRMVISPRVFGVKHLYFTISKKYKSKRLSKKLKYSPSKFNKIFENM